MRRYERYKDSGVEWLGEIPTHWECVPLRSIFKFRNEKIIQLKRITYYLYPLQMESLNIQMKIEEEIKEKMTYLPIN